VRKVVSFCFDDGLRESTFRTARLFEDRGVLATFCVLAQPSASEDPAHTHARFADWDDLRALRLSGHDIAPHGWAHERLGDMSFEAAQAGLARMFGKLEAELPGFDVAAAVFHAAYLQMPPDLSEWVLSRVRAIRVACGRGGRNGMPADAHNRLIDCVTFGPSGVLEGCERSLDDFMRGDDPWQVLVLHGLDGEGWGAISESDLARLVDRVAHDGLAIRSVAQVLDGRIVAG
jgi:hypothetical protein